MLKNIRKFYSPNFNKIKRKRNNIKYIIIHYTGMKREQDALKRLTKIQSEVSSHYFIKNNGKILNLVPDLYAAWHAGVSNWKNYNSLNKYSIGIEINNPGHNYKYNKFYPKQINSLIKLLKYLTKEYNINKINVLGHSDISPERKKDPGEKFPWKRLAKLNLCKWHNLNEKKISKFRNLKVNNIDESLFYKNLQKIGYSKASLNSKKNLKNALIKAFQRKFRQNLINGKIDKECYLISKNLLKR